MMTHDGSAADAYAGAVTGQVDADAIRNADLTVVLDCANGASFGSSPLILSKLGVRAMTINASPHMGPADRPGGLTEDGLKDTLAVMRSVKADLGIVHDGDAGGVAFITDDGIFAGADRIMALMAKYMLSKGKGTVVTPVSSSSIIGDVVKAEGGTLFCTALTPSAVAKAMTASKAVFGGEGNGGLIFPKHQLCRDGAMAAAMMLECVAKNGPLSKQIKDIPSYHIERRKIDCPDELKADLLKHLGELNRDIRTDATDGIKMLYDDGWVLARPSGTEPKFRICSESKDKKIAIQRANETEIKAIEFVESLLTKDKV
jgi:phosphomannomutase/phosphoglucomutase